MVDGHEDQSYRSFAILASPETVMVAQVRTSIVATVQPDITSNLLDSPPYTLPARQMRHDCSWIAVINIYGSTLEVHRW